MVVYWPMDLTLAVYFAGGIVVLGLLIIGGCLPAKPGTRQRVYTSKVGRVHNR
jgi:hypothetical protein